MHPVGKCKEEDKVVFAERTTCALIVPTLNGGGIWQEWLRAFEKQSCSLARLLVVDSESTDDTRSAARRSGFDVRVVTRASFSHGGTRQIAAEWCGDAEVIIFMTQDAVLADGDSLSRLIGAFDSLHVGMAYGRQLPRRDASSIEAHGRLFSYPHTDRVVDERDIENLGIKAAFASNSFAAYRVAALREVGGFPKDVILGEDTVVAARMLLRGWSIAYCADATVFHSHNYSVLQEFRRYFDIGVLHSRESWLLQEFGSPGGEGLRFVLSELRYLGRHAPWRIPEAFLRTMCKLLGYRIGRLEGFFPQPVKRALSMHKHYWK